MYSDYCGSYDDVDFTASAMCCGCGGGSTMVEVDGAIENTLEAIIIGEQNDDVILFILTFILSCFSACLGLAKCLKNGVARPIAPGGPVDGLLSGRFILAFIASACCLVVRGYCIVGFISEGRFLDSSTKFLLIPLQE